MGDRSIQDPAHLRSCFSRFPSGVVVVSYRVGGQTRGLTVSSFTAVSLDPALVLVSVARSARAARHLGQVPFTVNVLRATQVDTARHFAGVASCPGRVDWAADDDELAPTLGGALVSFRCQGWSSYDGGDHRLFLGQVVEASVGADEEALLFYRGDFWGGRPGLPLPASHGTAA